MIKKIDFAWWIALGLAVNQFAFAQANNANSDDPKLLCVVLLGGQSNADGRAPGDELPVNLQSPQPDVPFYYYTSGMAANPDGTLGRLTTLRPGCTQMPPGGFGPEVTLGHNLARVVEQTPGTKLAIIKYAKGGSSLGVDWKPNVNNSTGDEGVYYKTFQNVVKNGLSELRRRYPHSKVQLAGMIWVQGESDIDGGDKLSRPYGANLANFISDMRAKFDPALPFYLSRISSQQTVYSTPTVKLYPDYLLVRSGQAWVAATVDNARMIDTDAPTFATKADHLHFDARGQQALGAAFAALLESNLKLNLKAAR